MRWNFRYTAFLWIIISLCTQCKQNSPKPNSVRQIDKNWVLHVAEKDTFLTGLKRESIEIKPKGLSSVLFLGA